MKNSRIFRIFGIALVLALLLIAIPVSPVFAVTANSVTLTPTQGAPGATIALHGELIDSAIERWAIVYFSSSSLAVGTGVITSAPAYEKVIDAVYVPSRDSLSSGIFDTPFTVPASLTDGIAVETVIPGTYYVYVTVMGPGGESNIQSKATFTVTAPVVPTLDPLSPASGPAGQAVVVSGANFPVSTALSFIFDLTTTLTPISGDTSTRSSGLFLSTIVIPSTAAAGTHALNVLAGTANVSAIFSVTGGGSGAATITITPASGAAGSTVSVSGVNFPASTALGFLFDTAPITPNAGSTATTTGGIFSSTLTIPSTATAGAHTITATAGIGSDSDTFTVSGGGTSPLSLDHASGAIGSTVNIGGSGFIANHAFTITYDGASTNVGGTVLGTGLFFATLVVPPSLHGAHTIAASDGTNTASATFTVESTPPATPQPLRPYMDEAVSSPPTFDWDDVTDASLPVTYRLQVATSANFTTDSILINKTGITTSQYTLSDADLLMVTTGVTYYWREKAVDAAQNESAWTGANSFSITQGFSFTGWPLYATIAIGAILLFLIGIWLGRRSAYNY